MKKRSIVFFMAFVSILIFCPFVYSQGNNTAGRGTAQDFNTTRSNRERSNFMIVNGQVDSLTNQNSNVGLAAAKPGNPIGGIIVKGGKNPGGEMKTIGTTNEKGELLVKIDEAGSYRIAVELPINEEVVDSNNANINTSRGNIKQPKAMITTDNPKRGLVIRLGEDMGGALQPGGVTNENGELLLNFSKPGDYKIVIAPRAEAQDFNTTRSNRERSNFMVVNGQVDTVINTPVPPRAEAQDFNTTRSNRERSNFMVVSGQVDTVINTPVPPRAEAQDFNTTRSNRERSNFMVVNGQVDTVINTPVPPRAEAQDFNTTRSNRERSNFMVVNGQVDTVINTPVPPRAEAQDFNTTRSNRERSNFLTVPSGQRRGVGLGIYPLINFPLEKDNNEDLGLFKDYGYGVKIDGNYYRGVFGIGAALGLMKQTTDMDAVKAYINANAGNFAQYTTSDARDVAQLFILVGPSFQFGQKILVTGNIQGGVFFNHKPSKLTSTADVKGRLMNMMTVTENNKKLQPGLSGHLSVRFPIVKNMFLGVGAEYMLSHVSTTYNDYNHPEPVSESVNMQSLGASVSWSWFINTDSLKKNKVEHSGDPHVNVSK